MLRSGKRLIRPASLLAPLLSARTPATTDINTAIMRTPDTMSYLIDANAPPTVTANDVSRFFGHPILH